LSRRDRWRKIGPEAGGAVTDIYNIDRFTVAGALSRFVRTVAARPAEAGRLIAIDAAGISAIVTFNVLAWPAFMGTTPDRWLQGVAIFGAVIVLILLYLMWETAWQRFLAGKPNRPGLPWRLGAEEGLLLGSVIVSSILILVLAICAFAVLAPFGLLLSEGLGAPPAVIALLLVPVGLVFAVIAYRFHCGVSLTIIQGRMSVFHGFGGVQRHLWMFAGAVLLLTAVNAGAWVLFDLARGVPARSIAMFSSPAGEMPASWIGATAYMVLSALSAHLYRGIYIESALVTANLGPVPERGSRPDPVNTPAH
jgi:hypothetical protein